MRKNISRSPKVNLIIAIITGGASIFFFVGEITSGGSVEQSFYKLLGLLGFASIFFYISYSSKSIEFDEEFMYIKGKKMDEKIDLKNINKIRLTLDRINNSSYWKIQYVSENEEKSVKFIPKWNDFEEFKKLVKQKNPNVIIQSWAHSLEFD